jgi:hypothetical protein
MLVAAVLVGGAAASQAGIDLHFDFRLPTPPHLIISHPRPVVAVAPVCAPAPVVVRTPVCAPAPVCEPVVYSAPRPVYRAPGHYWSHDNGHDNYRDGRDYNRDRWDHDRTDRNDSYRDGRYSQNNRGNYRR